MNGAPPRLNSEYLQLELSFSALIFSTQLLLGLQVRGYLHIFRPKLYTEFAVSHTKLYTPRPTHLHDPTTVIIQYLVKGTYYEFNMQLFPSSCYVLRFCFTKRPLHPRPDLSPFKTKHLDQSCIVTLQSVIFVFSVSEGEKTSDLMVTAGAWVRTQWTV